MLAQFSFKTILASLRGVPKAIKVLLETPRFIIKHKLWEGFMDNTWVFVFSICIAALFSFGLYGNIHDYIFPTENDIEIPTAGIDKGIASLEEAALLIPGDNETGLEAGIESLNKTKEHLEGDHKPFISGSMKFLLLILLEVIIFHFAVKTNNILKDQSVKPKFKSFSKAQIRMLKVMGRKWFYVLIIYILSTIGSSILGLNGLETLIMFILYGYYFGFAFFDNYLEQFDLSIKESAQRIHTNFGAATVFGLFASLLMLVPLVGPLVTPFVCAVATTRYGHLQKMEQ